MSFNQRQVRRLYLTGTVPFPMPFPSVGTISFERATIQRSPDGERKEQQFLVIHEKPTRECDVARVVRTDDISAIFFPGHFETKDGVTRFIFSSADRVEDFDKGAWFFRGEISIEHIIRGLKLEEADYGGEESKIRGIVFVPEARPVVTRSEVTEAAGATNYVGRSGCDCCN